MRHRTTIETDFIQRLSEITGKANRSYFSYLADTSAIDSEHFIAYITFYLLKIKSLGLKRIFFLPTSSLESIAFVFFLIFSEFEAFILPNNFSNESSLYKKISEEGLFIDACILHFETDNKFSPNICLNLSVSSYKTFCSVTHPSKTVQDSINELYQDTLPGRTVFTSSGSTGQPKLIPLSINEIDQCYRSCSKALFNKLRFKDICCVHSPSFVIVIPFLFAFLSRNNVSLCAPKHNSVFPVHQLKKYLPKANDPLIISIPTIFRSLNLGLEALNNTNIISCGEPLDLALAKIIIQNNPASFHNLYGSTEVSPWILYLDVKAYFLNTVNKALDPILPVGNPLPDVLLHINQNNELLVNSKCVFEGYINHSGDQPFEKIQNLIYYNTGDRFNVYNGYYFCNGRSNSAVKICGVFVNPQLIESAIKYRFSVEDVICIPIESKNKLVIFIFYEHKLSIPISSASIKTSLSEILPPEIGVDSSLLNEKPRVLSSGKIDRQYYLRKVRVQ